MQQLSAAEFIAKLKLKLGNSDMDDAVAILHKQKINGKRAMALTTNDFFSMGIPFGDAMDVEEAINELKEVEVEQLTRSLSNDGEQGFGEVQRKMPKPTSDDTHKLKPTAGNKADKSMPNLSVNKSKNSDSSQKHIKSKQSEGKRNLKNADSNSTIASDDSSDDDDESDSSSLSNLTSNLDNNGNSGKKNGNGKPIKRKSTASDSSSNSEDPSDDKYDGLKKYFTQSEWNEFGNYEKSANLNLLHNYNKLKAFALSQGKSTTDIKMPFFMTCKKASKRSMSKNTENKENETPKTQNKQTRRVPYVKKKKMSISICYGPADLPECEYIETLPEYDVEAVLNDASDKLKNVRKLLKKNGIVFENDRKLMIRTLTKYIFFESVKNPKEITQLHKEGLAASICAVWPKFRDESTTRYSWNVLFYRKKNSGFIANCVQNIYRSLDKTERRRPRKEKKSKEPPSTAGSSGGTIIDPLVEHKWISLLPCNKFNHNEILTAMQESFGARRNWIITKAPTITDITRAYVHLMSYGGEVLDNEFSLMQPGKLSCLLKEFPTLTENVKRITSLKEIQDLDCEGIQVLLSLTELLPSPNILKRRRGSQERAKASVEDILVTFTRGTDAKTLVASKRNATAGKPVQPYLLAFVPDQTILKMFVVCDSEMIEIVGSDFLKGLDLLFKSYFVFNVEYPLAWTFVFQFLEHGVFKIDEELMSVTGKELLKRLSSV